MWRTCKLFFGALAVTASLAGTQSASAGIIDPAANGSGCCLFGSRGFWFEAPEDFTLSSVWLNTVSGLSESYNLEILQLLSEPPQYPSASANYNTLASFTGLSGAINVDIDFSANDLIGILAWDNNLQYTPYSRDFIQTIEGSSIVLSRLLRQDFTSTGPLSTEAGGSIGAIGFSYNATASAVPEPETLALFALGLVGVGLSRRKRAA